jgi:lipoprotein Spr
MLAEDRITRARALLGVPFRLHGRCAASGVDCIGLVAMAANRVPQAPTGYSLRTTQDERWIAQLDAMAERIDQREPGALLLLRPGPAQLHLGLWTGTSLIHADAGVRRVVETPGVPRWPVIGIWQLTNKD